MAGTKTYKRGHKFFRQLRMICKSVATENSKWKLDCLYVCKEYIAATDGKRLACLTGEELDCLSFFDLEPGYWGIGKCTQNQINIYHELTFENAKAMELQFPTDYIKDLLFDKPEDGCGEVLDYSLDMTYFKIARAGACINVKFLKDYIDTDSFFVQSPDKPVGFFTDLFKAVIMPINT